MTTMTTPPRSRVPTPGYDDLKQQWTAAFGSPSPHRASAGFLRLALAWHAQMQASEKWRGKGGYARLLKLLKATPKSKTLTPGTRLVRQWQGQTYQVTVLDSGFEFKGEQYSSLSAIARQITGTPWSGPLFFGLKS